MKYTFEKLFKYLKIIKYKKVTCTQIQKVLYLNNVIIFWMKSFIKEYLIFYFKISIINKKNRFHYLEWQPGT